MAYILGEEIKPSPEEVLAHHGVKGMKWGVRKEEPAGRGGGGARAMPHKTPAKPKAASADQVHAQRVAMGKLVIKATLGATAAVGATALAGPIAGAAVGTAVRAALNAADFKTTTTTRDSSFDGPGIQIHKRLPNGMFDITDSHGRNIKVDESILNDMLSHH